MVPCSASLQANCCEVEQAIMLTDTPTVLVELSQHADLGLANGVAHIDEQQLHRNCDFVGKHFGAPLSGLAV